MITIITLMLGLVFHKIKKRSESFPSIFPQLPRAYQQHDSFLIYIQVEKCLSFLLVSSFSISRYFWGKLSTRFPERKIGTVVFERFIPSNEGISPVEMGQNALCTLYLRKCV